MSVFHPRNRLVNFRLSDGEFERLRNVCSRQGARSVSDFARNSVLRCLEEPGMVAAAQYGRLSILDQKVSELEIRVDQLLRVIGTAGRALMAQSAGLPIPADGDPFLPAGVRDRTVSR